MYWQKSVSLDEFRVLTYCWEVVTMGLSCAPGLIWSCNWWASGVVPSGLRCRLLSCSLLAEERSFDAGTSSRIRSGTVWQLCKLAELGGDGMGAVGTEVAAESYSFFFSLQADCLWPDLPQLWQAPVNLFAWGRGLWASLSLSRFFFSYSSCSFFRVFNLWRRSPWSTCLLSPHANLR